MRRISTVAIVGAGTMGRRIALSCVASGKRARLFDVSPDAIAAAQTWVRAMLDEWERHGPLGAGGIPSAMARLSGHATVAECVADADLAIESVPERVALKRAVFAEVDRHLPADGLIASNTSAIPGSRLADATRRPDRVVNMNFGHAEHVKVEVMRHAGTSDETFESALEFVRELGLVPIAVRGESVGYGTNRVWRAVKKEVLGLIDRGLVTPEDVDRGWMLDWGTPIGPCGLMDRIGLDVVRDIEMVYFTESGDPSDRPPKLLDDLIAAGRLGEKSGAGFYEYPSPAYEREGFLKG